MGLIKMSPYLRVNKYHRNKSTASLLGPLLTPMPKRQFTWYFNDYSTTFSAFGGSRQLRFPSSQLLSVVLPSLVRERETAHQPFWHVVDVAE